MRSTSTLPLSFILPLFLCSVLAQESGSNSSSSYVTQCVSALQSAGFGGLAETLTKINGTPVADQLFSQLSSGRNFTFFAPDDQALQQIPSDVSGNSSLLAEYLSYHFVDGDFTNSSYTNSSGGGGGGSSSSSSMESSSTMTSSESGGGGGGSATSTDSDTATATATITQSAAALFGRLWLPRQDGGNSSGSGGSSSNPQPYAGVWPNVTLGRTLLNASGLVMLEGNKSQVLAWTRSTEQGNVTILNQINGSQNITVVNGTTWNNLFINGINGVLIPPGNLTTALAAVNATAISSVLNGVQLTAANGTNETAIQALQEAHGITVFIPSNEAFTSEINSTLQGLQQNTTVQLALIQNHYVNGTTLYSTQIDNSTTAVSAAGNSLTFVKNATGTFINGANNSMAQIVRPDVLLSNGVAHIIDHVLLSTDTSTEQAASAYESATSSAAAHSTTETGPIGGIVGGGGQQSTQTQESSSTQSSSSQYSSSEPSTQSSSTESTTTTSTQSGGGGGGSATETTATETETQSASA